MIYSMTGYAVATRELPQGTLNLELRSVNHRYLDIQFRLSEELRALEPAMREALAKGLVRGKVDCRLNYTSLDSGRQLLEINTVLLEQLVQLTRAVQARLPDSQSLRVVDVLRWPGMFGPETPPVEALHETSLELLRAALEELRQTRAREGGKLKQLLLERAVRIEALVAHVAPKMPGVLAAYEEKLLARLREVTAGSDEERIRQELALFAQRIDVDEELSRLKTHLQEVGRVLDGGGTVGKRLDFLMQELNREANTLASKSVDSGVTQAAMELKVLIEQMREQIQNIE